jgi:type I restriction enzyme M protein
MEAAVDPAILSEAASRLIREMGLAWSGRGYGGRFGLWLAGNDPGPCYSLGNGAGMRVGPCGWAAATESQAKELSRLVTAVTHNHPEGLKGAEAVAMAMGVCVFMG